MRYDDMVIDCFDLDAREREINTPLALSSLFVGCLPSNDDRLSHVMNDPTQISVIIK